MRLARRAVTSAQLALRSVSELDPLERYAAWFGAFGPQERRELMTPGLLAEEALLLHLLNSIVLSKQALARGHFNEARLREMIEEHCAGRRDHDKQLWILLQLELWHLMFIDRTLTPSDRLV